MKRELINIFCSSYPVLRPVLHTLQITRLLWVMLIKKSCVKVWHFGQKKKNVKWKCRVCKNLETFCTVLLRSCWCYSFNKDILLYETLHNFVYTQIHVDIVCGGEFKETISIMYKYKYYSNFNHPCLLGGMVKIWSDITFLKLYTKPY